MKTHSPELGGPFKFPLEKILDFAWLSTVAATLVFSVAILLMLLIGVAVDFNIIKPPPLYCHYLTGEQIDDFCK